MGVSEHLAELIRGDGHVSSDAPDAVAGFDVPRTRFDPGLLAVERFHFF